MRIFTAIDLPSSLKAQLGAIFRHFPDLRWVKKEQLHFTLKFLGEVAPKDIEGVKDALKRVQVPHMILEPDGVGFFPDRRDPAVFWISLKKNRHLLELWQDLELALEECGFSREKRAFRPHITLLRIRRRGDISAKVIDRLCTAFERFPEDPFEVSSFRLFSSELLPSGARHTAIGSFGNDDMIQ